MHAHPDRAPRQCNLRMGRAHLKHATLSVIHNFMNNRYTLRALLKATRYF